MKKITFMLLALIAAVSANAQVTVGELVYRIQSGNAYVSAVVDATQTDITIPASITYDNAGTETTSSVRGIWPSAFKNNAVLENVFVKTNPNYFTFQASCFEGCSTLKTVTFESNQNRYYYNNAFKDCTSLTQVGPTANRVQLANNLTTNSEGVFMGCTSIQGVGYRFSSTKIGKEWFKGCTSLTIANLGNASEVGESAFEGCTALASLNLTSSATASVVNMSFGKNCFKGCTAMTYAQFDQVKRPITAIAEGMFEGCTSLATVISVYTNADDGKTYYGDLNGITSIGANAFKGCSVLTRYGRTANVAIFPEDLNEIGASAFEGCSLLGTFRLYKMDAAPTVGEDAFTGIKENSAFYIYPTNSYKAAGKYGLDEGWKVFFDGTKANYSLYAYVNKSKQYGTVSCAVPLYFRYTSAAAIYKVVKTSKTAASIEAASRRLPANTGAILEMGVTSTNELYTSTQVQVLFDNTASETPFSGNLLVANVEDNTDFKGQENGKYNLILVNGEFVKATDGTLAGGLAYLPAALSDPGAKLSLTFGDEVTGIENVGNEVQNVENGAWYTPQGVRVAQPTKGVYIHNGKKVLVK